MSFFAIFLLAATAVAADGLRPDMEQRGSLVLSKQQIEREEVRHKQMVDEAVERRLLVLGTLVLEGMKPEDAVSLHKSLATELAEELGVVKANELKSTSSVSDLVKEAGEPIHTMICHIQKNEDNCAKEWSKLAQNAVKANSQIFSELGSNLLQFLTGSIEKKPVVASIEEGETDPELLKLLKDSVVKALKIFVRVGEDPDSMLLVAQDTMDELRKLDSTELLKFSQDTRFDLVKKLHVSLLHSLCRAANKSCVDDVASMVANTKEYADGQKGTSLLEAALRPAVRVVLKLLDIPEFPEETAAERAEASLAYLEQRRLLKQ